MHTFSWPIRVYYEDTDAGGVVYYANYLKFFERARTEMLRSIGFEQDVLRAELNILFVVHAVQLEYLKPAKFNELLQVDTEIIELKKTRLVFRQLISKEGTPLCRAQVSIACVNETTMRPTAIPATLIEQLNNE